TPDERRSAFSLSSIYALRMLGLFMVMPVFMLEARHYEGGDDLSAVGMALGVYGLVQAVLQIPFGMAADRFGRKRVIYLGLALLALGSIVGAMATSVAGLALGRALQGGGAISAAVTALLADQTRDAVRTKGTALVGASIGLMFALSLVLGPLLSGWGGLSAIFGVTLLLAVSGVAIVRWWTPAEPELPLEGQTKHSLWGLLVHADLIRLNFGVFALYAVQLASWVAIPALLIQAGVASADHGWVYLPAVLLSFVVMGVTLFPMERRGLLRPLFLGCIVLVMAVQAAWSVLALSSPPLWSLAILLFLFFCGFNVLEASQPSLASRLAPMGSRGAALGVYNTLQSLGIFAGGAVGGLLIKNLGASGVFTASAALMLAWLGVAWGACFVHKSPNGVASAH
ncbi:MAG: MFS transporter, partial [Betaproteobacteria bacterium]|nr:MFS transporter [Betaproteobacteria bacterium]